LSSFTVATDRSEEGSDANEYAVPWGSLPSGVSLSAATGALTGTPTVSGVYSFSVTATETDGSPSNLSSGAKAYSWTINETTNDAPVASGGTRTLTAHDEGSALSSFTVATD